MHWDKYASLFRNEARRNKLSEDRINQLLLYAEKLYKSNLPIIYDQYHLCQLIGINHEYIYKMTNAPEYFYRTFYIPKSNGKRRRIDEPLPDLKKVQKWILSELLYNVSCSKYAKAYIPKLSIKNNVRFHVGQKMVVTLDIKNFFSSLTLGKVLNIFLSLGYTLPVSVMLSHLCCYNNSLPQGAPTSAYISNLILSGFDETIGSYAMKNRIRYTRYADDLTLSGDFNIVDVLDLVDKELSYLGLYRNYKKFKVMRKDNSQIVTGVVVNKKMQLPREYRQKIRQEIYYIEQYGISSHISHLNETRANYICHLKGKIHYCLFVNPNDNKMKEYLIKLDSFLL